MELKEIFNIIDKTESKLLKQRKLGNSLKHIKCCILVLLDNFIFSIISFNLASNTIADTSLLINEFSNSSNCNPLSNGTDTIPPNRLLR